MVIILFIMVSNMARVVYTTTIQEDLVTRAKTEARMKGYGGANDIVEKALNLLFKVQDNLDSDLDLDNVLTHINKYSKLQKVQIYEKELPNGKYQIVTIGSGHTCLDYVEKRITIDAISDIEHLISDGYHCTFEL